MVQGWTLRWLFNILAIIITAAIIPAFNLTLWAAVVGSIFLGVINAVIRPLLILLTLPLNLLTLGLFTLVINGFMLWVTSLTIKGFDIDSFGWAIICSILISVVSFIISFIIEDKEFKFK